MPAARDLRPVNPDDKRVINGMTDINQLAPFKYPWAWEYFLNANRNHWTPLDISMAQDVHDYHHKLTLEEKHVYENVLSYLTTSDIHNLGDDALAQRPAVGNELIVRRGQGDDEKMHIVVLYASDYTYDDTSQLTGADYDFQTDESYSYDDNGKNVKAWAGLKDRFAADGYVDIPYEDVKDRLLFSQVLEAIRAFLRDVPE